MAEVLFSSFTTAFRSPTSSSSAFSKSTFLEKTERKRLQRTVSLPSFFKVGSKRLSSVENNYEMNSGRSLPNGVLAARIAKHFLFLENFAYSERFGERKNGEVKHHF